ncbi:MAG TPA: IPT/TIG domain-containing protein, partial [Vicinamibacterales bacterium]|nr:IPT/TIG domain-containing protein [Vicinamibacterales bacterium]
MTVTLTGSGFGDGATVTFGGSAATNVVVVDQTTITCTPPAHADGFATVVVTNPDGTTGTLSNVFVYTTLSVSPTHGPIAGGTALTLNVSDGGAGVEWFPGSGTFQFHVFINNVVGTTVDLTDPDLIVNVGTGDFVVGTRVNAHSMTCVTPVEPCGPTDVIVVSTNLSAPNVLFYLPGGYTYQLAAPDATSITPTSGPAVGGTHVGIAGTFACTPCSGGGTMAATVGGTPLTSVGCSSSFVTGITGAHAAGAVDVIVTGPDGQTDTLVAAYTYVDAPVVTAITPDEGPYTGGQSVTITGLHFVNGASVLIGDLPATGVTVVNATTITATTPAHVADVVDVSVTNPDGQRGTLERGYAYFGWWVFDPTDGEPFTFDPFDDTLPAFDWPIPPPFDPASFTWWTYAPTAPGPGWSTASLTPPSTNGWWLSIAAFGGSVLVVADSRPKNPRTWTQFAGFATGSAAMLGGSPGIAAVFHNRLIYASSDYVGGTDYPPIRIFDGSFDRELVRLPPTAANAVPKAVVSLLVANGTIYVATYDTGSSSADWTGRVFSLELTTATLTPIGAVFPTGHLPYALAWHNGMLWCGTHRQSSAAAGKIYRIRPDLPDATWTEDVDLASVSMAGVAALRSFQGLLFAGTTAAAGTFAKIIKRATDGTWSTADTGSGGTATANN